MSDIIIISEKYYYVKKKIYDYKNIQISRKYECNENFC